jgi:hypothetical protein
MGYDMRFRKADPDEAAAVAEAQKIFRAACDVRDALPKSERGEFNMERAKREGIPWDSEDAYDGMSPRYRAAADQVHAAYRALNDAERSYFRLNISGMSWARGVMEQFGMAFLSPAEHPPWPEIEDYGIDWDDLEALEGPEYHPDFAWTDEKLRAACKYREERDAVLAWHGPEVPGIPLHKFGSNDGWIVLPAEAEAAVRIWKQKLDELGEDQARIAVVLGSSRRGEAISANSEDADAYWSLWLRWVAYLADSVRHDGFEVH